MRDEERLETYRGFGDTLARAFELVVTPLLFGLAGWALDGWLGLRPLLTIVLVVLAVIGMAARMYYSYDTEMRAHEERLLGPRGRQP